jgi:Uma2 family endonuclease
MSLEEFIEWVDEDAHAERVDGEVVETGATTQRHQEIALFLLIFMGRYVEYHECGEVFGWGSHMKPERSDRVPDLIFVAGEHRDRVKPSYFDGPADRVVEIIRLPILPER